MLFYIVHIIAIKFTLITFQISHWGNVEWSHELAKYDLQSRMAAAILFIHLNSHFTTRQPKLKANST